MPHGPVVRPPLGSREKGGNRTGAALAAFHLEGIGALAVQQVAIIDFGMGNLRSVEKAVRYVGGDAVDVLVTADPARVAAADRVVFPGQGAIGDCMSELAAHGLEPCVQGAIREKPFLGICIGLQALMEESEEDGGTRGLAAFRGRVTRFPPRDPGTGSRLKVPHMGWNQVRQATPHPLWRGIEDEERFYFVHSYYVEPADPGLVAGSTDYAVRFTAALAAGNVFAVQFHPEKSQRPGLQLLSNFFDWRP